MNIQRKSIREEKIRERNSEFWAVRTGSREQGGEEVRPEFRFLGMKTEDLQPLESVLPNYHGNSVLAHCLLTTNVEKNIVQ